MQITRPTDIGPVLANPQVRNGVVPIIYNIGPILAKQLIATMVNFISGNILACIGNIGGAVFVVVTSVFTRGHHTLHWIIATFLDRIVSVVCSHRVTSLFVHISY